MHTHPDDYIKPELMACCGAREITDGNVVIVGTGFPAMSANIAKYTNAPNATLMQESGVYDAKPARPALSVGDPCLNPGAAMIGGLVDVMGMFLQSGWVDVGFLSGSQVDKFGNINTTVIGDYEKPVSRLPGSGGQIRSVPLQKRFSSLPFTTNGGFPNVLISLQRRDISMAPAHGRNAGFHPVRGPR